MTDIDGNRFIKISVKSCRKNAQIRVMDSGNGIPTQIRDQILEPFFTTKDIGKGTGLGLSISKGIADDHGGQLFLDTDEVRTTFVIELPKIQAKI